MVGYEIYIILKMFP